MPCDRTPPRSGGARRATLRLSAAVAALLALSGCGSAWSTRPSAPSDVKTADAPKIPKPRRAAVAPTPPPAPAPVAVAPAPAVAPPAPIAPRRAPSVAGRTHTVVKGDTVYSLGKRYGVTPAQIQSANGLDASFTIKLGQQLLIPGGAPSVSPTPPRLPAPPASYAPTPAAPGKMTRPVTGPIVGVFGETAGSAPNDGVDIAAAPGAPVRAAAPGTVAFISNPSGPVGPVVIVKHGGGMITVYGRVERVAVRKGQTIAQGATIAHVATPKSGPATLHFELRRGSEPVDPTPYL
ncbi:MAG: LysM peptidoglycan-binding domain-containing M23 family metallopeptidase [Neomegalonema sp.]|nr:LysM peptidoglycan-binding domain-containing M23 family metallopeptidase [Neomegalonema sp.]